MWTSKFLLGYVEQQPEQVYLFFWLSKHLHMDRFLLHLYYLPFKLKFSTLLKFCQTVSPYTCHPLEAIFLSKDIFIFDEDIQHQLHWRLEQAHFNRRNLECPFSLKMFHFSKKRPENSLLRWYVRSLWIARSEEKNINLELKGKKLHPDVLKLALQNYFTE